MNKIKILILVVIAVYFVFGSMRILFAFSKGFSKNEMDWNQDGRTTLDEMMHGSEIEKRTVNNDGQNCTEYYLPDNGHTIKILCQE